MKIFISPLCCSKLITRHQSLGGDSSPDAGLGSSFCWTWGDSHGHGSPAGQKPFECQHNSGVSATTPSFALSAHLLRVQFVPSPRMLMKILKYSQHQPEESLTSDRPADGLCATDHSLAIPAHHISIHFNSPHCTGLFMRMSWTTVSKPCESLEREYLWFSPSPLRFYHRMLSSWLGIISLL